MPCYFPVGTYRTDGSHAYRPCGQCIGCRLEYSRQWGIRAWHEASLNLDNCFITLTYNNKNLPEDRSVHKEHIVEFVRETRRFLYPKKIRYLASGEYGENLGRPHYHICLFNHSFGDRKPIKPRYVSYWKNRFKTGPDHLLYTSKTIEKLWDKGFHTVGEVTLQSAAYTARYITKKVTEKNKEKWYQGKNQEFALMSRMPGLGNKWIKKYMSDIYPKDYLVLNGNRYRPPKYYDSVLKKEKPKMHEQVMERRRKYAEEKPKEHPLRGMEKEYHRKSVTKRLERKLENAETGDLCNL